MPFDESPAPAPKPAPGPVGRLWLLAPLALVLLLLTHLGSQG